MRTTFTTLFAGMPLNARKTACKMLIGSMNSSLIGLARTHIRQSLYENVSRQGQQPTIDTFNDAIGQLDGQRADEQFAANAGLIATIPPIQAAAHLAVVRGFCTRALAAVARTDRDLPLSLDNTLDFQLTREPDINEAALHAMGAALDIDGAMLVAAKLRIVQEERAELINMRGQITALLDDLDATASDEDDEVDTHFEALPAQTQYRLMAAIAKAMSKAAERAIQELLKYNRIAAAADVTFVKAVNRQVRDWAAEFAIRNAAELQAYEERGGVLAEMVAI